MFSMMIQELFAQNIGINTTGTTPDNSAMLDVNAANKGMLVPRISLTGVNDVVTILLPATSLLVWNTNASMAGGSGVGFYYNAGTTVAPNWVKLVSTADLANFQAWRLTGNSGTHTGINFLGTTDTRALAFRTNNIERIKIDSLYGRVGIGTDAPVARLHVVDSSVVFSATGTVPFTPGNPPISGAGRRMMWYSDKAAFRVGGVTGTSWDKDSIGLISFAAGADTRAIGVASVAMGNEARASGFVSTSIGNDTKATGDYSVALGDNTISTGRSSTAMGGTTIATGNYSTAMGNLSRASGNFSTAMGDDVVAVGNSSTAMGIRTRALGGGATSMGNNTHALGTVATAMGLFTYAKAYSATSMGMYNDTSDTPVATTAATDRIFQIGNGASGDLSNAVTVLKNGNMSIGNFTAIPNESRLVIAAANNGADEGGQIQLNAPTNASYNTAFFLDVYRNHFRIMTGTNATSSSAALNISDVQNVGLGVLPNAANKLEVSGKTQTTNFQMTNGANLNYILRSDGAGNASWVNPASVFFGGGGTLDQAYDFGGGGVGRTITADAGAVLVQGTDGLQVTGSYGTASGSFALAGTTNPKMLFVPSRGAFRAGRTNGGDWDLANIGNYSFAGGYNTRASGMYSTAFGNASIASGTNAFATGSSVSALGEYSTAMGFNARAERDLSLSIGVGTIAKGEASVALGYFTKAKSLSGTVLGMFNDTLDTPNPALSATTDRLFQIGNGTVDESRSNAVTVLKNGNMSIGNFTAIPNESRLVVAAANNGVNEGGQIQLNAPSSASHNTAFYMDVFESRYRIMTGTNANSSSTRMSITNDGNVGIGGMVPTQRLHVDGKVRIVDGTQANNYFLASDANGVSTWKPVVIQSIAGTIGASGKTIPYTTANYLYTGCFITLPPGKYSVSVTMLMQPETPHATTGGTPLNSSLWLRSTFADVLSGTFPNQTGVPSSHIEGGTLASAGLVGPAQYQMLIGTIIINNSTAGNRTYYYCAGNITSYNTTQSVGTFGGSGWSENRIVAIPME